MKNLPNLVERLDIDFLNGFSRISDSEELVNYLSFLRDYTLEYINRITIFTENNWLVKRINEYMIYSGKMLRSSFFYIFFLGMLKDRLLDERDWDKVLRLGAIFELVHSATLVHDDILDGAKKRRGKPSVHIKFGVDGAIIFGDILIISVLNRAHDIEPMYSKILMETLESMCFGEVLQYQNRYNVYITEEEYFRILSLKTGVLFGAISKIAYHLSCIFCNKVFSDSIADKIAKIFDNYGIAFQIVDDVLDYTQSNRILKKDSNNDLLSGRVTYPLILILSTMSKDKLKRMRNLWLLNPSFFTKIINQKIRQNKEIIDLCINKSLDFLNISVFGDLADIIGMKDLYKDFLKRFLNSLVYRQL